MLLQVPTHLSPTSPSSAPVPASCPHAACLLLLPLLPLMSPPQVLGWDDAAVQGNAVVRALRSLFRALEQAEAEVAAASGGNGLPPAAGAVGAVGATLDPSELREALAALPGNDLFRLGGWVGGQGGQGNVPSRRPASCCCT